MPINQAVIFTKPVHHLRSSLSPEELNEKVLQFFQKKKVRFVYSKMVRGTDLKARDVIKQHYLMYSAAARAENVEVGTAAKERFKEFFGRNWQEEADAGRIVPMPRLLERSDLDVHQLYTHWLRLFDDGQTVKLQDGFIMGFVEELDVYVINGFYPSMEANFYHPETVMYYHVAEFDPSQISWRMFRRDLLGTTNACKASAGSFRGKLYREVPVEYPGRDNYVHGSAGPFEGFVERTIHEADFDITTNPVGAYLAARGATLSSFAQWRAKQSLATLGALFDETEEKNTGEILQALDVIV